MTENIYLVGFMGSGKNAVGRELASMLNRKFVDMDTLLENRFGMPIREVFATEGEGAFRDAESALLNPYASLPQLLLSEQDEYGHR